MAETPGTWVSNHMPGKMCDEIDNIVLHASGCAVDVWERIGDLIDIS